MDNLQLKEFSLQTHAEFKQALTESKADLPAVAENFLTAFAGVMRTEDISLHSGDGLFSYRLTLRMFNGSADVVVSSKSVSASFRDGRSTQALNTVGKCIEWIWQIAVARPVNHQHLTFSAHAQFESQGAYERYMARYVDPSKGYLSGGKVIQASGREFEGELRFAVEKSVVFDNSIFVQCQFTTLATFNGGLLEKFAKRFGEITRHEGLELIIPNDPA